MNTEMNNDLNSNMNSNMNNMSNPKPKGIILIIFGAVVLLAAGILIGKFLLTTPESNKQENSNVTNNENVTDNDETEEETTEEKKLTVAEATLIISNARDTTGSYIKNVVLTENCSKDNSAYSVSYDVYHLDNPEFDPAVPVKLVCVLVKENGEWVIKYLDASGFTPEIAKYDLMCD